MLARGWHVAERMGMDAVALGRLARLFPVSYWKLLASRPSA